MNEQLCVKEAASENVQQQNRSDEIRPQNQLQPEIHQLHKGTMRFPLIHIFEIVFLLMRHSNLELS